jgi:bacterioferritin
MGTMLMNNIWLKGARTPGYKTKSGAVVYLLHEALATEIICVLRYKRHYFTATGTNYESVEQSLRDSIRDDLVAQRIAIDSCRKMIRRTDADPANRRTLNDILANEEEHAEDLTNLLKEFCPDPIPASSTNQALPCSYSLMPISKA